MPKSSLQLLDEILTETGNYRCEYLQVLIQKYVKTEDEVVDIHIRNCTISKPSNYLKRMGEKPFGYVSSYECKTAKKTVQCWKKKVILQKRASFRKYVGVKSSDEDYHFTNDKKKLNYLTRSKAYETLLSIQKDNSCSSVGESENTLLNETDLDDGECSTSFGDGNENSLSNEDSLSDTVENIQSKMSRKNETVKSLATTDKKLLSTSNVKESPSFEIKDCEVNLLKSSNHKQVEILIANFFSTNVNEYDGDISKIKYQNMATHVKGMILSSKKERGNRISSIYDVYNNKSVSDYVSSKCTPKFKFSDIGMGISNKNCQVSKSNVKSLVYDSNKSTKALKPAANEIEVECANKNYQASCNYNASNKSVEPFKIYANKIEMRASKYNGQVSVECANKNYQASCNYNASNKSVEPFKIYANKIETRASKNNGQVSNDCSVKLASKKPAEPPRFKAYEKEIVPSKSSCQISSDFSDKSSPYSTKKSTEPFRLKVNEAEMQVLNKASRMCNSKSLICTPSKSVESPTHRFNKTVTGIRNKNRQTSLNSSLMSTSVSFPLTPPKLENFVNIDPLSLRKVSKEKNVHKNRSSLVQTSLPFRSCKKYSSYLENIKVDDLSLRNSSSEFSSFEKTPKHKRKEANKK